MKSKIKKIIMIVMTSLTIAMFMFAISILIIGTNAFKNNQVTSIFNYTYSVVPTPSMANPKEDDPIYPNEIVIGKKVSFDSLKVGDTIIYYSESNKIYICHRIVDITNGVITTKGTNNAYEDDEKVTIDNYVSKVVMHKNFLNIGKIVTNNRSLIFISLTVILLFVILSEALNMIRIKLAMDKQKEDQIKKQKLDEMRRELEEEIKLELQNKN